VRLTTYLHLVQKLKSWCFASTLQGLFSNLCMLLVISCYSQGKHVKTRGTPLQYSLRHGCFFSLQSLSAVFFHLTKNMYSYPVKIVLTLWPLLHSVLQCLVMQIMLSLQLGLQRIRQAKFW